MAILGLFNTAFMAPHFPEKFLSNTEELHLGPSVITLGSNVEATRFGLTTSRCSRRNGMMVMRANGVVVMAIGRRQKVASLCGLLEFVHGQVVKRRQRGSGFKRGVCARIHSGSSQSSSCSRADDKQRQHGERFGEIAMIIHGERLVL